MRRKIVPLLSVLVLLLVATGGVAAADDAGTAVDPTLDAVDSDDTGICLVGVDSPCNDAPSDDTSDDDQIGIPEDQDGDGEIDDRFRGGDDEADVGICLVGVDSPCNGDATGASDDEGTGVLDDQDRDGSVADRVTALLEPLVALVPFVGGF